MSGQQYTRWSKVFWIALVLGVFSIEFGVAIVAIVMSR